MDELVRVDEAKEEEEGVEDIPEEDEGVPDDLDDLMVVEELVREEELA